MSLYFHLYTFKKPSNNVRSENNLQNIPAVDIIRACSSYPDLETSKNIFSSQAVSKTWNEEKYSVPDEAIQNAALRVKTVRGKVPRNEEWFRKIESGKTISHIRSTRLKLLRQSELTKTKKEEISIT